MTNRDTDARHRSDAAARETGCSPILIALVVLALGALAWAVV